MGKKETNRTEDTLRPMKEGRGEWRAEGSFFFYSDNRIVSQHYGALYI